MRKIIILTILFFLINTIAALADFVDNGNGTVTDTATGLMWQQASQNPMNWEAAITYCETLPLANYGDWRLPNRNELQSLVDYSKYNPCIDTSFFPGTVSSHCWSSTTSADSSGGAWLVNFFHGGVASLSKSSSYYVRAVRGGQSGSFADLGISGRVADVGTDRLVTGALVTLDNDSSVMTNSEGKFLFRNLSSGNYELTVAKNGYHNYTDSISVTEGTSKFVQVRLAPDNGMPAITNVSPDYSGIFLENVTCSNTYTVKVVWAGNPGQVKFIANGVESVEPGTLDGAGHTFDMGYDFNANNLLSGNTLSIVAVNSDGVASAPVTVHPVIISSPAWSNTLGNFEGEKVWGSETIYKWSMGVQYPSPDPFKAKVDAPEWFPFIGGHTFGLTETQASLDIYFQNNGEGGIELNGDLGFEAAGQAIIGSLGGNGIVQYVSGEGLVWAGAGFNIGLSGKISKPIGIVELIPALAGFANIPGVSWFNKKAIVRGEITPGVDLGLNLVNQDDEIQFESFEGTGEVGIEIALALNIAKKIKAELYGGGSASLTLQVPKNPDYLKAVEALLFAGVEITVWLCKFSPEASYLWTYPENKSLLSKAWDSQNDAGLQAIQPDFLKYGTYNVLSPQSKSLVSKGATSTESKIIENVYAYSEPVIVENGSNLIIAFVYYDPEDPDFQNTEIYTTLYDSTGFSDPAPINDDTRAEFNPQLATDASGNTIAVWERVKVPDFSSDQLSDMAAQMEIVYSIYTTGGWSGPISLTDNLYLDHSPQLRTMPNGSLFLFWESNNDNELISSAASPCQIHYTIWDGASWGSVEDILTGFSSAFQFDAHMFAGGGILVWTQDGDDDLATLDDQEIFYAEFNGTAWSGPFQMTDNIIPDSNPQLAGDESGFHLLWLQEDQIVQLTDIATGAFQVARPESSSAGYINFQALLNNQNNLVMTWPEQDEAGTDIFYSVYDQDHNKWGKDNRLTTDTDVEKGFNPLFMADGTLMAVYNKVKLEYVSKEVEIDGQMVTIENVPEAGQNDLYMLTYQLSDDLGFTEEGLTISEENPAPGTMVTLSAEIINKGDFSLDGVEVAFYDGNIWEGGVQIGSIITVPDVLDAGATFIARIPWQVPGDELPYTLFARVDPGNNITEKDELNNLIFTDVLLPDFDFIEGRSNWMGSDQVSLVASVKNTGSSKGENIIVEFLGPNDAVLKSTTIKELAPGLTTEVEFLWTVDHGLFSNCQAIISIRINNDQSIHEFDLTNNKGSIMVIKDSETSCCGSDRDNDGDVDGADLAAAALQIASGDINLSRFSECFGSSVY
ncbi:MAG: DUF1566 domain-containing protein [Desulfobacula sp.]|uniref:Lcl domain-containing protein n=1 Tax=Desulfobacula sp. TaxID=2593537 RepID=UPI0025C3D8FB|nr:DUF1566 domain-containing protein [Desulfobacula sp.]MCD4718781.1 DUF1566 domain-containing protein [Desulfobacula sp.]